MRFIAIGGDERMVYAARELCADTLYLGENMNIDGKYSAVVLPVPLSKDGENLDCPLEQTKFPLSRITEFAEENAEIFAGGSCPALEKICSENGFALTNYFANETLTLKNAKLTAEAAVMLMIQSSKGSVLGSRTLITGYGRIAKFLASAVSSLGGKVTVAARKPEVRAQAELDGYMAVDISEMHGIAGEFDYIANTAPAELFTETDFNNPNVVYIELASMPQEPTKSFCQKHGVNYIFAGGLPGKYSPKTAGIFIAETIQNIIFSEIPRKRAPN